MALAEPLLIGAENQRNVRELRRRLTERAPEQQVLWGVRYVIVAADDVRDLHLEIVDDNRQMIRGQPVRSKDDEVLDLRVVEFDCASDAIHVRSHARRHKESNCRLHAGGVQALLLLSGKVDARAIVFPAAPRLFRVLALQLNRSGAQ